MVGAYFQGDDGQDVDDAQRRMAMELVTWRRIERTATPKAKAKAEPRLEHRVAEAEAPPHNAILGLMVEGQKKNLIRDSQILDLMSSRKQC